MYDPGAVYLRVFWDGVFGIIRGAGIILGAVYMLHMTGKVIFGPLKFPGQAADEGMAMPSLRRGMGRMAQANGLPGDLMRGDQYSGFRWPLLVLILGVFRSPF